MSFLNRLFNIKFGEKNKILNILLFFSLSSFYMVSIETLSQSLFNARVGVELLPLMFISLAFGIILSTIFFYSFKIENRRLFFTILFSTFFLIHISVFFIIALFNNKLCVVIFFLLSQTVSSMFFTAIWLILQDVCNLESSKRIFPLAQLS
ncbi:MAG TPA: hypothetical protein PK771_16155 [Spirochaetota bacterium]|nr:hypothetical protein [Spirochaetota bacterium]